ncbi:SprT-like domain-containing protein [Streptomyces sp. MP131-18]|uniref:M48 family metallopeptidase n=1 Tax=Streptomyces sp. MP131-18 TaxID=1857892 RepID=UPI00097BEC9A|nr:SprT-like domain-containing protein [Streptomyces sp. MP131-18]ONK13274.1 SprT-like family protein [Streptomyces sp. MP131-18]
MTSDLQRTQSAALQRSGILDGYDWTLQLRTRRRSLGLTIKPGGHIVIAVPPDAPTDKVLKFIEAKRHWIKTNVAKSTANKATPRVLSLADGKEEDVFFLGNAYRLRLNTASTSTSIDPRMFGGIQYLNMPRIRAHGERGRSLISWYQREGTRWAQDRAAPWLDRLRLSRNAPSIQTRDLGTRRWGVYRRKGHRVELHWPLFQLPDHLVEYVLVHELIHATRPPGKPHGPEWQARMTEAIPYWRLMKKELNQRGPSLWIGHVAPHDEN